MVMAPHLDYDDPKYAAGAAEILRRHDNAEAEANITSAVRDFLILTGLAKSDEIDEENPPSDTSRSAVDLTALDTFVEMKRRIGTTDVPSQSKHAGSDSGSVPESLTHQRRNPDVTIGDQQGKIMASVLHVIQSRSSLPRNP